VCVYRYTNRTGACAARTRPTGASDTRVATSDDPDDADTGARQAPRLTLSLRTRGRRSEAPRANRVPDVGSRGRDSLEPCIARVDSDAGLWPFARGG
jgi:hypothetical protein